VFKSSSLQLWKPVDEIYVVLVVFGANGVGPCFECVKHYHTKLNN
jgi:hypothetical protein